MTDIYPIKSLVSPYPIAIFPTIFAIILGVVIFYILNKNKKQVKDTRQNPSTPQTKLVINCDEIINLKDFYKEIEKVLRDYLQNQGIKKSHSLSFKEIEKLKIDETLKDVLKSVYFKQYKLKIEDNLQNRKKICELVKQII